MRYRPNWRDWSIAAFALVTTAYLYHLACKPIDGGRGDGINWHQMQQEAAGRNK